MSIPNDVTKCPSCGATATVTRRGHLEQMRCELCGWQQDATIYTEEDVRLIDEDHLEQVRVYIEWTGQEATSNEVAIARRAFALLSEKPLQELLQEAKQSTKYEVGVYPLPLAVELQERGKAHGLSVFFRKLGE